MLNPSPIVSSPSRPSGLLSAAAAVLHGACPLTVSDIAPDHPALAPAVRELAADTGMPVPVAYLALPESIEDMIEIDPRENFPHSAHEADDHYEWAKAHGLATPDTDEPDSDSDRWNGTILF